MLAYMKASPTTYVLHYRDGRLRREGPGLAFWYLQPASTIVAVPLASRDVPFVFNEVTADFQAVTIQGQLTYRVADPRRLAELLDFSIRPGGAYVSEDPEKVPERLVQTAQILARGVVQARTLREVLVDSEPLVSTVLPLLRTSEVVRMLGLEILGLVPRIMRGAHAGDPRLELRRARTLTIESERPLLVEADGEIAFAGARRLGIGLLAGALTVLA